MMRFGVLALVAAVLLVHAQAETKKSQRLVGKTTHRNAADLKAYHQKQRQLTKGQNYIPQYPDEPIISFLEIGTPAQAYFVALETGESTFWVTGVDYPSTYISSYDPSNSSTGLEAGYFYGQDSGGFSAYGPAYTDLVTFLFTDVNQTFGAVDSIYGGYVYDPELAFDGIYGLSWDPSLANQTLDANSAPVLNWFAANPGYPRIVSMWRESQTDGFGRFTASITEWGGALEGSCDTNWQYAPLAYEYYSDSLSFDVDSFSFGNYTTSYGDLGKIDSGLPVILVPYEVYYTLYDTIQPDYDWETSVFTTPCTNRGVFPDWVFTINGQQYRIPSTSYIVDLELGDGKCSVAFDYTNYRSTSYALGYPFLTEYCQLLDIDNAQVGFATAVKLSEGTTQSP